MAKQEFPINTGYPFIDFVLFMFSTMIFVGLMFLCFVLYAREHVKEGNKRVYRNGITEGLRRGPWEMFNKR